MKPGSDRSSTTITTSDGFRLHARWWRSERPRGSVVVLAHGFSGSKEDASLGAVAEALCEAGHDVLSYDARGHHGSEGVCTLGDLERHDVAAAVAAARERSGRVVTVGASMGGIAVLRHAAGEPDLAGVVSVSSPARWRLRSARSVLAAAITQTSLGRRVAARRMHVRLSSSWEHPDEPLALVPRVEAPVAVVHGREDRFVPPSEGPLLAAAAPNARLFLVPGMGHAYDRASIAAVVAAVEWTLTADAGNAN